MLAEYALKVYNKPLGVLDYQINEAIPDELKSQLSDVNELENELIKKEYIIPDI